MTVIKHMLEFIRAGWIYSYTGGSYYSREVHWTVIQRHLYPGGFILHSWL